MNQHIKMTLKFGDLVRITSGFYQGETAILTYLCPESGCYCGYIEGDGTNQLHYFYAEELEILDRGFYFSQEETEEDDEVEEVENYKPSLIPMPKL